MKPKTIRIHRSLAVLFCTLSCLGAQLAAQELTKSGRYYVAEISRTFKVGEGGTIRIFEIRGDVVVSAWAKPEVFVKEIKKMDVFTREEAETVLERSKSSYRQEGNDIAIGGEYYRRDWIKSVFEVSAPTSFSVDIQTRGGDLAVSDLAGAVKLSTSGGEIVLRNIGGRVNAKTSGGDIRVINADDEVTLKTSGGDLELEDIAGPLTAKTSGGDITLRTSGGEVILHTSGGSIEIEQVQGDLEAHTSGGDITVVDTQGDVEVHTSGGDIRFRNVGGALDASTSGGDIRGRTVVGSARVSTAGGDIEIDRLQGGIEGKTAGGDIIVEMTLTDFSKEHRVELRTAGGEIRLVIPEKLPARIRAEIEVSDRWESYNIYSDFPLTSSDQDEDRRSRRHRRYITSEGEINGGGNLIDLYTHNGNIYIKKLR
ncbi:MAG: DUF4097 domain-containing protein [bacterium]